MQSRKILMKTTLDIPDTLYCEFKAKTATGLSVRR